MTSKSHWFIPWCQFWLPTKSAIFSGHLGSHCFDQRHVAQCHQEQGHLSGGLGGWSAHQEDDGEVPPQPGGCSMRVLMGFVDKDKAYPMDPHGTTKQPNNQLLIYRQKHYGISLVRQISRTWMAFGCLNLEVPRFCAERGVFFLFAAGHGRFQQMRTSPKSVLWIKKKGAGDAKQSIPLQHERWKERRFWICKLGPSRHP